MPIIKKSNCVPLPIVVCPVLAVVVLEFGWQDVFSVWRMLTAE